MAELMASFVVHDIEKRRVNDLTIKSKLQFLNILVSAVLICQITFCHNTYAQASKEEIKNYEVLVVLVYDEHCTVTCTKVRPVMRELASKYGERIKYLELNSSAIDESSKTAAAFGVKTFLSDSTDLAPIVGIFSPSGKRLRELIGFKERPVYEAAIDRILKKK